MGQFQKIEVTQFDGGISSNTRSGPQNSCRFSRNLSIYEDSDSVTLNPKPIKETGSIVTGLVKWIVDALPYDTNRYAYDDGGKIYKVNSSNTWSFEHTVGTGSPTGQGLGVLSYYLFYATSTTLGRLYPLQSSPAYYDDFLSNGTDNLDLSATASGNTYTTPVAIAENAADKIVIQPTKDPLKTVSVYLGVKGTGNWTVTIHDVDNISLGSATVANASLTNGTYNDFTFSTPIRIDIGRFYHIHVTSTVADGTVQTGTAADLSTAQYKTYFGILIADTDYHPIITGTNGVTGIIAIGNEHYIATYDLATYNPNKITLEPGFKVRSAFRDGEFLVFVCWKGSNIDSTETGRLYYWDGISPYYNYYKEITNGLPNAVVNSKNRIFSIVGSSGDMALGIEPVRKIQPMPKLGTGKKVEVYPAAITNWRGRIHFAYSNTDDGTNPELGVYEFGNQSDRAITYQSVSTEVLNYGYQISTGTTRSTGLKIGCVAAFGKDLYISWNDNGTYGVDRVSKTNDPAATGSWESLIYSDGVVNNQIRPMPQKTKLGFKVVVTFEALPTGCTVTPKYKLDRATSFTTGTAATAGATRAELILSPGGLRYKEVEFGFDITATVNYPKITGVYFEYDPLINERDES